MRHFSTPTPFPALEKPPSPPFVYPDKRRHPLRSGLSVTFWESSLDALERDLTVINQPKKPHPKTAITTLPGAFTGLLPLKGRVCAPHPSGLATALTSKRQSQGCSGVSERSLKRFHFETSLPPKSKVWAPCAARTPKLATWNGLWDKWSRWPRDGAPAGSGPAQLTAEHRVGDPSQNLQKPNP